MISLTSVLMVVVGSAAITLALPWYFGVILGCSVLSFMYGLHVGNRAGNRE